MHLPYIAIVTEAQRANLNLVLSYIGWGPETFMRRLCADSPSATDATPPTHRLSSAAAGTEAEVQLLQQMTAGVLPALPDGYEWGTDGILSEADALACCDGVVLQIYTAAGEVEPLDHANGILAGRDLMFVPDPEV